MNVPMDGRENTMDGHYTHKAASQHTCVDKSLEQIPGSGANTNGYLFYTVEAYCGHHIPCSDKEITCVVCTKWPISLLKFTLCIAALA